MTVTSNPIEATGLFQDFHGLSVLQNVTLSIAESECVALTGPNGSGKTTLVKCLAGAISPIAGTVSWYGQTKRTSLEVRRLIGLVAHQPQVYPQLTVRENLVFAARMTDMAKPKQRADRILQRAGLQLVSHCLPARLSRGMHQRLAIARAIVHDPKIVLLDEPFSGLDQQGRDWLGDLIADFCTRRRAVCFTSHDAHTCARLARRVLRIQDGSLQEVALKTSGTIPLPAA